MARNEDGEFELILGNKQLLSVFFLVVLLLGLCFVGGYALGRSAAPVVTASNVAPAQPSTSPVVAPPVAKPEPPPVATPTPEKVAEEPPPIRTSPQVSEPASAPSAIAKASTSKAPEAKTPAAKAEVKATPKSEPAAPKQTAAKQGAASSQPVPGRTYLQLSATDKDKAEVMVGLLRRKNFSSIAAPVAEKPGLFRVLVGPLADNAVTETKAQLKAGGFPADDAIRRVF